MSTSKKWDVNWEDKVDGVPDAKDIALFDKNERNGIVSRSLAFASRKLQKRLEIDFQ